MSNTYLYSQNQSLLNEPLHQNSFGNLMCIVRYHIQPTITLALQQPIVKCQLQTICIYITAVSIIRVLAITNYSRHRLCTGYTLYILIQWHKYIIVSHIHSSTSILQYHKYIIVAQVYYNSTSTLQYYIIIVEQVL